MFHADFLIDDKDVVKTLRFIASIRAFEVKVVPAINAKPGKNRKAEEEIPGGGTVADRIAMLIFNEFDAGHLFERKDIFTMARKLGNSPNSLLITSLIKSKAIKKKGRGKFVVLSR